jgi:hypothetical protein
MLLICHIKQFHVSGLDLMIKQWDNEGQFQFIIEQNVLFSTTITDGNRANE